MNLTVDYKVERKVMEIALEKYKAYVYSKVDIRKLCAYASSINIAYGTHYTEIMLVGELLSSMNIIITNRFSILEFSQNKKLKGTSLGIYDVVKWIDCGGNELHPYPIFSEAFKFISDSFNGILYEYRLRG